MRSAVAARPQYEQRNFGPRAHTHREQHATQTVIYIQIMSILTVQAAPSAVTYHRRGYAATAYAQFHLHRVYVPRQCHIPVTLRHYVIP